jgi:2,4-dienoyl-CoA reductase-like NADH-dependent reductase (Old Yellow Enzyme family)
MDFPMLFSPIRMGTLELANRFVVPPIATNYAEADGSVSDRLVAYWEARARGGWGLLMVEATAVDPRGKAHPNEVGAWDDRFIPGLKRLADAAHRHRTKAAIQLHHAGRQTVSALAGAQPVAPSPIPCPVMQEMPRELSVEEIWALVGKFGDAARRAREAGFDAVEVHAAHGFLVAEFMSEYSNQRTDAFGGSLENRMRFPVEIVKAAKRAVGADYPVCFRFSGDEKVPRGLTAADAPTVGRLAQEAGADGLSVTVGVYESVNYLVAPISIRPGHLLPTAAQVKRAVSVPVIAVGRITEPTIAENALTTGMADLIAFGRQSLADPETPNKVRAGRLDDIVQCDACMKECLGRYLAGQDIACALNPACGHEAEMSAAA